MRKRIFDCFESFGSRQSNSQKRRRLAKFDEGFLRLLWKILRVEICGEKTHQVCAFGFAVAVPSVRKSFPQQNAAQGAHDYSRSVEADPLLSTVSRQAAICHRRRVETSSRSFTWIRQRLQLRFMQQRLQVSRNI